MTDKQVRSDEARRNFRDLLDEVALGAHITILRYDKPAAMLVPLTRLDDHDRRLIARAREVAAIPGDNPVMDRAEQLGHAKNLLAELADIVERLGGPVPDEEE